MHASTDDNGTTRFLIERDDGSRLTFAAVVTDAVLEMQRDYDTFHSDGFAHRVPMGRDYTFEVRVNVLGAVTHTSAIFDDSDVTRQPQPAPMTGGLALEPSKPAEIQGS